MAHELSAETIPRQPLQEMPPPLAQALEPRVARLGYLGEFFQCVANQPDALLTFIEFTEAGKAGLDERLVELIALTMASITANEYERNQHERLAVRLGLGREWVSNVEQLQPADLDAQDERIVQEFLLAAAPTYGREGHAAFGAVVECLGPQAAIAVLLVTGRYLVHALVVNTLMLSAPVPSIFEDGFDGS